MSALRNALVSIALGRELPLQPADDSSLNPILSREAPEPTHDDADVMEWLGQRQDPDGWIIDALADYTTPADKSRLLNLLPEIAHTRLGQIVMDYIERSYEKATEYGVDYP